MINQIIKLDCWEVYESYDRDVTHIAYFSSKYLADSFVASKGPNKNYYSVVHVKKNIEYNVCESLEEFDDLLNNTKRKAAIAKLSDEEIKLLGISV